MAANAFFDSKGWAAWMAESNAIAPAAAAALSGSASWEHTFQSSSSSYQ